MAGCFGDPNSKPDYNYYDLTRRGTIELSLKRKNRYLAWWMHEMAVAIILRRQDAALNWRSGSTCETDLESLLTATTEHLLAWHHGKLKSVDFHIPYRLQFVARKTDVDVHTLAQQNNLEAFVTPTRMNFKKSWQFQRLLLDPKTGSPVLNVLQHFIGRRHASVAYLFSKFRVLGYKLGRASVRISLAQTNLKLNRSERRLRKAEAVVADLKSRS